MTLGRLRGGGRECVPSEGAEESATSLPLVGQGTAIEQTIPTVTITGTTHRQYTSEGAEESRTFLPLAVKGGRCVSFPALPSRTASPLPFKNILPVPNVSTPRRAGNSYRAHYLMVTINGDVHGGRHDADM